MDSRQVDPEAPHGVGGRPRARKSPHRQGGTGRIRWPLLLLGMALPAIADEQHAQVIELVEIRIFNRQ